MKPVLFDPDQDIPPIPFDHRHARMAEKLKQLGLPFEPHVGCFVLDPREFISVSSPFPNRIYFILSMPRFIDIFGTKESIVDKLVWLPTWHQARLCCEKIGIGYDRIAALWHMDTPLSPGEELLALYSMMAGAIEKKEAPK